jgi:GNAT superfamily N-acetyltransferase
MRIENVTISAEGFHSEAAHYLIGMLDNDLTHRYPGLKINAPKAEEFEREKSFFVIARNDGVPIGCGGLVNIDENTCEVKRMFVEPYSRGRGVAKMILLELERLAKESGFSLVQLETGQHQPEAIIMYEHNGYSRIPCFRQYKENPHSHCYEKSI